MCSLTRLTLLSIIPLSGFCQTISPQSPFITYLIESAEAKIKKSPTVAEGYSDLAFALARRLRETENPVYGQRAEQAVATALKWDPTNFEARKARVIFRIQQSRLADAKEEATALNKQTPDDNLLYGLLADIALAQGHYPEAETLTQRMLDLRQVNGPGLQRAARVREIIGFPDGANEFWISSLRLASTGDTEERAYILTQLAGLSRRLGKLDEAGRHLAAAFALEPDYPAGLLEQARIALDRQKPEEALALLTKRLQEGESTPARYWKFIALKTLGREAEARTAGEQFLALSPKDDLLIRYLMARGAFAEAAAAGKAAVEKSTNVQTSEAYAMALLATGKAKAAAEQMDRILAIGIKDPAFFLDAAKIRIELHDAEGAKAYLKKCIEVNATSPYASQAFAELQKPSHAP